MILLHVPIAWTILPSLHVVHLAVDSTAIAWSQFETVMMPMVTFPAIRIEKTKFMHCKSKVEEMVVWSADGWKACVWPFGHVRTMWDLQ